MEFSLRKTSFETAFIFAALLLYIVIYINFDVLFGNHTPNLVFNLLFRTAVLVMAVILIFKNFSILKTRLKYILPFVIFFAYYFVRGVWSFYHVEYNADMIDKIKLDFFYKGVIVLFVPTVAILSIDHKKVDYDRIFLWGQRLLLLLLVIYPFIFFFTRLNFFSSYYIAVGHYAATLLFISLSRIIRAEKINLLDIFAIAVALFSIFITAARSPFLAVVVVVPLIILYYRKLKFFYYYIALMCFVFLFVVLTYNNMIKIPFDFFERLSKSIFEGNASGRLFFFEAGMSEFLQNPVFGQRVLLPDGTYPHNFILDILMSVGVLGLILFIFYYRFVIASVLNIYLKTKNEFGVFLVFALFVQYTILDQTSGVVYQSFEEWYFGAALIGIFLSRRKNISSKFNISKS